MPSPAGYRTALRLFQLAERFGLPVVTLVDTCGAWPSFEVRDSSTRYGTVWDGIHMVLHGTVWCGAVWCDAMWCDAMWCGA